MPKPFDVKERERLRIGFLKAIYEKELREFKRRLVLRVLRDCDGSKSEAARRLGIARGYLHRLINQLRIEDIPEESFAEPPELDVPVM